MGMHLNEETSKSCSKRWIAAAITKHVNVPLSFFFALPSISAINWLKLCRHAAQFMTIVRNETAVENTNPTRYLN